MRLPPIAVAVLLFSAALSARADAVYDFESTPSGTALPITLTSNGLTATFSGSASVCSSAGLFTILSGNVVIQDLCAGGQSGALGMSFSQTLNSLSFDFATAVGNSPLTVNLFEGATLVGTDTFTPTVNNGSDDFQGVATITGNFNSVRLSDADLLAFDNVDAVPTPEPGSLALLGSGFLGLAGIVRRRS